MKTICFYFQIHQPLRLKQYRFFDIGADHYYYDDFNNESIISSVANNSFIPANRILLDMINQSKGAFKVAFSVSGVALEQLEMYAPEVIDGFKGLVKTGCVEFLAETYGHSLASLSDEPDVLIDQIKRHTQKIEELFGQTPKVFRNTELIYSDEIGDIISSLGYKGVITEGAKHILGWKSPNYIYTASGNPNLKLLLRNSKLSEDITFRFSDYSWNEYPLTVDKLMEWIDQMPQEEQLINIFTNYETFGQLQSGYTGIFDFLKAIWPVAENKGIGFVTPSEAITKYKAIDSLSVPYPISWADEARDVSAWQGNLLQKEALEKLYSISQRLMMSSDRRIKQDWTYLQTSDHFYYMSTRHNVGDAFCHYTPYDSPYDAFTNYMNVLGDFIDRVNKLFPEEVENEELNSLLTTIHNQEKEIVSLKKELKQERIIEQLVQQQPQEEPKKKRATKAAAAPKATAAKKKTTKKTVE